MAARGGSLLVLLDLGVIHGRWCSRRCFASNNLSRRTVITNDAKGGIFARDRLRTLLPRLQQQHKEAQEKEYVKRWRKDFERVEAKRDDEYAELYPQVVERLVDLLFRVEACDREALQVNCRSPAGARAHLSNVELTARGIKRLLQPEIEIAKELRLPTFRRGANEPLLAWPPPQPNLALQYLASMPPDPFVGSEAAAGTYFKERDRRVLEDNRRQIAEAERSQREFEKRKAAEAEAAKERDR